MPKPSLSDLLKVEWYWQDFLAALVIIVLVHLFRKLLQKTIFILVRRVANKMKTEAYEAIVRAFEKPAANLITLVGIYMAWQYLSIRYIELSNLLGATPVKFFKAIAIIFLATGFYNMGDLYGNMLVKLDDKLNLNTSTLFKEMISKFMRFFIVVLATGMALSEFFDVNGFIAGLGIAGLAFAMAAQDTLGNIIAGASIVIDRPYDLGDWILCEGVEGEVEELTFRSTRIRTATKELVYIPNGNMAKNHIINFSRRGFRRVEIILTLAFQTESQHIEALRDDLLKFLNEQPYVLEEGVVVKMDGFGQLGIQLNLRCYVNTNIYAEYVSYKEMIGLKILDLLKANGVEAAKPIGYKG